MAPMRIIRKKSERGNWNQGQVGLIPRHQLWFYHPEMRARVAEAETDFRKGRYIRTDSLEAAQAYLDTLKQP